MPQATTTGYISVAAAAEESGLTIHEVHQLADTGVVESRYQIFAPSLREYMAKVSA